MPRIPPMIVSAAVTLAVVLTGITLPSFWRDESATVAVATRPTGDLLAFLGTLDAVHGLYYLLMRPVTLLAGTGELAMRLPSALAVALAAAGVAALGSRLVSPAAGLLAGLLYAAAPAVSRAGQDARSYALVGLAAVLATVLFERTRTRRSHLAYGLALVLLGCLHLFALLLVAAHGTTRLWRREPMRRWLITVCGAGVAVLPLALLAFTERGAVSWMTRPDLTDLAETLPVLTGTYLFIVPALLLARERPRRLVTLAVPWLLVPALLLAAVSFAEPMYDARYLFFCLPAGALLAGAGLVRLAGATRAVALGLVVVIALPVHLRLRQEGARLDDLRAVSRVLAQHSRPGDAVLFRAGFSRHMSRAYPEPFGRLEDLALARTPAESATLDGVDLPDAALPARPRVWMLGDARAVAPQGLRPVAAYRVGRITLTLCQP